MPTVTYYYTHASLTACPFRSNFVLAPSGDYPSTTPPPPTFASTFYQENLFTNLIPEGGTWDPKQYFNWFFTGGSDSNGTILGVTAISSMVTSYGNLVFDMALETTTFPPGSSYFVECSYGSGDFAQSKTSTGKFPTINISVLNDVNLTRKYVINY